MIINVKNKILGRACTEIAKKLLTSEEKIVVVNSRYAIISGQKEKILKKYKLRAEKKGKGNPSKNPQAPRYPDLIFKRTVRGMLPRSPKGVSALKRLKVFIDVPEEYSKEKLEDVKKPTIIHITLEELSINLGSRLKKI
jgi:large subunit ribosomal protein L13